MVQILIWIGLCFFATCISVEVLRFTSVRLHRVRRIGSEARRSGFLVWPCGQLSFLNPVGEL